MLRGGNHIAGLVLVLLGIFLILLVLVLLILALQEAEFAVLLALVGLILGVVLLIVLVLAVFILVSVLVVLAVFLVLILGVFALIVLLVLRVFALVVLLILILVLTLIVLLVLAVFALGILALSVLLVLACLGGRFLLIDDVGALLDLLVGHGVGQTAAAVQEHHGDGVHENNHEQEDDGLPDLHRAAALVRQRANHCEQSADYVHDADCRAHLAVVAQLVELSARIISDKYNEYRSEQR